MGQITEELNETIENTAKELTKKYGVTVTPFAFIKGEEVIVGYLKEPSRLDKMRAIDMYEQSRTQAGDIILRTSLCVESDPRILDEKPENDPIYLGAIEWATRSVTLYNEQLKKK